LNPTELPPACKNVVRNNFFKENVYVVGTPSNRNPL